MKCDRVLIERFRKKSIFLKLLAAVLFFVSTAGADAAPSARQKALAEGATYLTQAAPITEESHPFLAERVLDPVIAYLISLIDGKRYGVLGPSHFEMAVAEGARKSFIPYERILEVRRSPGRSALAGWMQVKLTAPLRIPVGYKILGLRPGTILLSQEATFEEYRLPSIRIPSGNSKKQGPVIIKDVILWGLVEGEIVMALNKVLETLLLRQIDDTWIIGLALFRYQGVPYVAALGIGKTGRGRSGLLDLEKNKVCFPSTAEEKAIGRHLRARVINLLARREIRAGTFLKKDPKKRFRKKKF